jgi:adenylate cyclase class 2
VQNNPGKEIEVKLRIADRDALLGRLAHLKTKRVRPRVHEMNTLYDTSDGALARRKQMLRIRVTRPAPRAGQPGSAAAGKKSNELVTVTYKGPVEASAHGRGQGRYKMRDEREVRLDDARAGAKILEAFGLAPRFRYEKYRTTFRIAYGRGAVVADLDETPIGTFLELEGRRSAIDAAARGLGFSPEDYIAETYVTLYIQQGGEKRRTNSQNESQKFDLPDMLFPKGAREGSKGKTRKN